MELVYILLGVVGINLFTIFIVKKKFLIQFFLITSFLVLLLLVPQYLVQYGYIDKTFFDMLSDISKKWYNLESILI